MNSGRLNVGLATTAPNKKLSDCHQNQYKRTCRLIDEELQRERAAMDGFFPRAIIGRPPDPSIPVLIGALQQIAKKALWNSEQDIGYTEKNGRYLGEQWISLFVKVVSTFQFCHL
jgi:hypothetical protein